MSTDLLFVYGTLRQGLNSPMQGLLDRHCEFFAPASFQGTLYDVAGYPGAVDSHKPANRVYGELYYVSNCLQFWPRMDHYEHCSNAFAKPHQYARKIRPVLVGDNEIIQAWIYLFNWKTGALRKITGGDYLQYLPDNH